jgi:hypothetical protein
LGAYFCFAVHSDKNLYIPQIGNAGEWLIDYLFVSLKPSLIKDWVRVARYGLFLSVYIKNPFSIRHRMLFSSMAQETHEPQLPCSRLICSRPTCFRSEIISDCAICEKFQDSNYFLLNPNRLALCNKILDLLLAILHRPIMSGGTNAHVISIRHQWPCPNLLSCP